MNRAQKKLNAVRRDAASTRKDGIVLIQVYEETRALIKQLAAKRRETIPGFLRWGSEQLAGALDETVPESYKTEQIMDHQLKQGNFYKIEQKQPKDEFNENPTKEQLAIMDKNGTLLAFIDAWESHTGRIWQVTSVGGQNVYE